MWKYVNLTGDKRYELSNHLGNVLVVINDKKIPEFEKEDTPSSGLVAFNADVLSYSDYYPFGMLQDARQGSKANYRYGFNGKEKDDELKGEGNSYDYGMRGYDARIGKFLSLDPLAISYPNLTPYQYANNSPIANTDLDGLESLYFQITHDKNLGKSVIRLADIKTSYLDKILPYHVVVSVNGGEYMYAGDYALSFEGQRRQLVNDLTNYAKNPQAAVKKFTEMREDAELAYQENKRFWGHDLWVDAVTTAWGANIKKGTYTNTGKKTAVEKGAPQISAILKEAEAIERLAAKSKIKSNQKGLSDPDHAISEMNKMINDPNYVFKGRVGIQVHGEDMYINEGNHKMAAALLYQAKTGSDKFVKRLIDGASKSTVREKPFHGQPFVIE